MEEFHRTLLNNISNANFHEQFIMFHTFPDCYNVGSQYQPSWQKPIASLLNIKAFWVVIFYAYMCKSCATWHLNTKTFYPVDFYSIYFKYIQIAEPKMYVSSNLKFYSYDIILLLNL